MADPGRATLTADTYNFPFRIAFLYLLGVVAIVMADGGRDAFIAEIKERRTAYDGKRDRGLNRAPAPGCGSAPVRESPMLPQTR